jgi:hypothetical protein
MILEFNVVESQNRATDLGVSLSTEMMPHLRLASTWSSHDLQLLLNDQEKDLSWFCHLLKGRASQSLAHCREGIAKRDSTNKNITLAKSEVDGSRTRNLRIDSPVL